LPAAVSRLHVSAKGKPAILSAIALFFSTDGYNVVGRTYRGIVVLAGNLNPAKRDEPEPLGA
jgi:hypothetical protein